MNMTRGAVMLGQKASFRRFLSDLMELLSGMRKTRPTR